MSDSPYSDRQEAALLDVVRLALSGDERSLRQRARNLLRAGEQPLLSESGRRYLAEILRAGGSLEPTRKPSGRSRRPGLPTEVGDGLHVDRARDARPPVLDRDADERVRRLVREHEHRHLLEEANL